MRTPLPALAGVLLVALAAAPAIADGVAGAYDVKFEEAMTTCDPVRFSYTRGVVRVDVARASLRVNIETIPQMVGVPAKSGKLLATTPKKIATTIQGIDGKYRVQGRVDDDGALELVLTAEYTRQDNGMPLCTQSWNLRGQRQAADSKKKSASGASGPIGAD